MPTVAGDAAGQSAASGNAARENAASGNAARENARSAVSAQVLRRWQALDPLLPAPRAPAGCGADLIVAGAGPDPAAIGTCEHWEGAPGSLDLTWGAARRFQLTAWPASPDVAAGLDRLLSSWREHLTGLPGAHGDDTAAVITWPSRDIDGVATLLRHGLAPLAVIAARPAGRRAVRAARPGARRPTSAAADPGRAAVEPGRAAGDPGCAAAGPGRAAVDPGRAAGDPGRAAAGPGRDTDRARQDLRIRRAMPADIDAVVRLGMEVIRFDAHFGGVTERPDTADALNRQAAGMLAEPDAWIWLAERGGTPVGMLYAERPESASWIAPMVRLSPVAYLELMVVLPGERGRGVSAALTERFHRESDAAGVAVTLLHYAQLNPLSAPFWSQQGYRPLWLIWEARPAAALR